MAKRKEVISFVPKEIESHLASLCDQNSGVLEPRVVLEDAKDPKSPIHVCFEWDDTEAARLHREEQARKLIKSYRVEVTTTTERYKVPAYVRDPKSERGTPMYIPIVKVAQDKDLARDVLVDQCNRARKAIESTRKQAAYFGMEESFQQLISELEAYEKRALQYAG